jgi:hypothetical protein
MRRDVVTGPADITAILRRARLPVGSEDALQLAIGRALERGAVQFEREARISKTDRVDFLAAGGVGIEAKARYPRRAIFRQLERYAQLDAITALVLVTGTAIGLPAEINGKPVYHVSIGRAAL